MHAMDREERESQVIKYIIIQAENLAYLYWSLELEACNNEYPRVRMSVRLRFANSQRLWSANHKKRKNLTVLFRS